MKALLARHLTMHLTDLKVDGQSNEQIVLCLPLQAPATGAIMVMIVVSQSSAHHAPFCLLLEEPLQISAVDSIAQRSQTCRWHTLTRRMATEKFLCWSQDTCHGEHIAHGSAM